jgi:RNase P subunit RPR2
VVGGGIMEAMSTNPLLDALANVEAYCENCDKFRPVRHVISRDSEDHREYHELPCTSCGRILFTYQQRASRVD